MSVSLHWTLLPEGVEYRLQDGDALYPVEQWPLYQDALEPQQRPAIPTLLALYEAEKAVETTAPGLLLPHPVLARDLNSYDIRRLGLPEPAPFSIAIDANTSLDEPSFQARWRLIAPGGRYLIGPKVEGAFLHVGRRTYLLTEPLYSLIHGITEINQMESASLDERMLHWSRLVQLLPPDADVSPYLRSIRVTHAMAFTLDLRPDEQGEITFDPILVYPNATITTNIGNEEITTGEPSSAEPRPILPPADQEAFAKAFRRFSKARQRYALGGSRYVVLDPVLTEALQVIRAMQEAPAERRREFARNPLPFLREHLEARRDQLNLLGETEIEQVLGTVFYDQGYGERVRAVGLWQPKILPWLHKPSTQWLPPAEEDGRPPSDQSTPDLSASTWMGGLQIDGRPIPIPVNDLERLREEAARALQEGRSEISYRDISLPVTRDLVASLDELIAAAREGRADTTGEEEGDATSPTTEATASTTDGTHSDATGGKQALLIYDNLEDTTFVGSVRHRSYVEYDYQARLRTELKPHQREGVEWLIRHWIRGSQGALLADDMGLGKTLQALAFLAWVQFQMVQRQDPRPILVIAPTGLLKNWLAEHDLHLEPPGLGYPVKAYGPDLRNLRRTGGDTAQRELQLGIPTLNTQALQGADWVLTTYETLRDYQHSFGKVRWSVIVFDEAQKMKDPQALLTDAAKAMQADFALVMTGTPVENHLADLWCIVDRAQPGLLRDLRSFLQEYAPRDNETEDIQLGKLQRLKGLLDESEPQPPSHPKVMLRRVKNQHLRGLPARTDQILREPMQGDQLAAYNRLLQEARAPERHQRGFMLEILQKLRKVSLHPWEDATGNDEAIITASARFRATFRALDEIYQRQEKVLIFLDFLYWQAVLQGIIQRRYRLAEPPLIINGNVSGDKRKARVDAFQEQPGFAVMIMSSRAGGVGLTITAANHVIHLSRWWNPAVEDQCTDRVYRIGQTHPVFVYYPMAIHPDYPGTSFDERLHEHLERKRHLSRTLLVPTAFTDRDIERLFEDTLGERVAPATGHP